MNIQDIKINALKIAQLPGRDSGKKAVMYFYDKMGEYYVKKTILDRARVCSAERLKQYLVLKKYILSVKKRVSILGFDVRKVFLEERK